jgi:hypothetical protein
MRWLRPTVPHDTPEEAVDDILRALEAAAHEAPPSQRAEAIRQQLLDDVGADRRSLPGLVPLAIAASVLVLGLLVSLGAPAVGSWLGEQLDRTPPTEDAVDGAHHDGEHTSPSVHALPQHEDPEAPSRGALPSDAASPAASPAGGVPAGGVPEPSPVPGATEAPVDPAVPSPPEDDDAVSPPPFGTPGPPSPIPTPPPVGPPPGTPGG